MLRWELTEEERQSLLHFTERLVRTPSPSGQEGTVASLIMDEMRQLGYDHVGMDETGNVLGRIGSGAGPILMFDSHMDMIPFRPRFAMGDSMVWGRVI